MRISRQFTKFTFSIVKDLFEQVIVSNNVLMTMETFRDTLKYLDDDYPKEEDGTAQSYTKLGNKQFMAHIEFLVAFAAEYGITLTFAEREWDRLLDEMRN